MSGKHEPEWARREGKLTQDYDLTWRCMGVDTKYHEVSTPLILELGILPGDDWIARPSNDSWLVPEAEYLKRFGQVN